MRIFEGGCGNGGGCSGCGGCGGCGSCGGLENEIHRLPSNRQFRIIGRVNGARHWDETFFALFTFSKLPEGEAEAFLRLCKHRVRPVQPFICTVQSKLIAFRRASCQIEIVSVSFDERLNSLFHNKAKLLFHIT